MSATWMATMLDQEQIEKSSPIQPRVVDVEGMPDRPGSDVADELGGRMLVRYLTPAQVSDFLSGSTREHWVTPTPVSADHSCGWLALPSPTIRREYAIVLDPAKIGSIRGPAWIRLGEGIEYYLPEGFPADAILDARVVQVR